MLHLIKTIFKFHIINSTFLAPGQEKSLTTISKRRDYEFIFFADSQGFKNLIKGKTSIYTSILTILLFVNCKKQNSYEQASTEELIPQISASYVAEYPHDTNAFTEGFLFHEGRLFESTGATNLPQTRSLFGEVDLETGNIEVRVELDRNKFFGEGITFLNGRIYQLTYKSRVGFVYDAKTYQKIQEFTIPSEEGWGLTTDGQFLIMSDGTDQITYIDPVNLVVSKRIRVKENVIAKENLNELEYVKGYIYANVWKTNEIVKIDPKDGKVVGRIDLSPFASDAIGVFPGSMEMNGIAYNENRESFFITGKLWPKIYEIKIQM
jgi:glutamine cyclotransferase